MPAYQVSVNAEGRALFWSQSFKGGDYGSV
jgi:hypothetical protein